MPIAEQTINVRHIKRMQATMGTLLTERQSDLNRAFLNADDALTVTFTAKLSPKGSGVKLASNLNYVAEKIMLTSTDFIDDGQMPLFGDLDDPPPPKVWTPSLGCCPTRTLPTCLICKDTGLHVWSEERGEVFCVCEVGAELHRRRYDNHRRGYELEAEVIQDKAA